MATITSRLSMIQLMLGNRTDIAAGSPSQLALWTQNSYLELAYGVKFAEMQTFTQLVMTPTIDTYVFPPTARAVKCITILDPTTNAALNTCDWKDIKYLRRIGTGTNQIGTPGIYNDEINNQLIFRPVPDKAYPFIVDFWQKPTISGNVIDTVLQVPDDWLEIIDIGAAMRGFAFLGERDKVKELQELLFGYQIPTSGKTVPGLITTKLNRRQASAPGIDYGMQPKGRTQSFTSK